MSATEAIANQYAAKLETCGIHFHYVYQQNQGVGSATNTAIKVFTGETPVLELPTDYPRPMKRSYEGTAVDFVLDKEETAALNRVAKEEGGTLFMVLLALFNVFLARLSGQEDIVVGTPVAGRYRACSKRPAVLFKESR